MCLTFSSSFRLDPNNKAIQPYLTKLHQAVSEKVREMSQVSNKAKSMVDIVFDPSQDTDKRRKAADNLIVLAREKAGADILHKDGIIDQIARLMKVEKDAKMRLSCIRCISELSKRSEDMSKAILATCGIPFFLEALNSKDEETVNSASFLIQVCLARKTLI